tara:strand:- start:16206 stop:18605 length:2400 start_codon:yes stop_codon:yes gene_type:complete
MTIVRTLLAFLCFASLVYGQEPLPVANLNRESPVDFNVEVVPFLKKNCFACHNETKAKAKLILESPEAILKGGDSGPAIEPGNAAVSLLFTTAAHLEDPVMPPEKNKSKAVNLTPEELALLKLWVDQGAKGTASIAAAAPKTWLKVDSPAIYTVAISDDGRFAAVGRGHGVQIYDLRQNSLAADLKGAHRDIVHSLAFSSDGTLASGGFRVVKLWKRPEFLPQGEIEPTKREPVTIEGMPAEPAGAPIRIRLGDKDSQLLTAGKDATIRIYQVADWSLAKQFPVGVTPTKVVLNAAKTQALFVAASGPAQLLQLSDGKVLATYQPSPDLAVEIERIQREEAQAKRLSGIYAAQVPKLEDAWKKEGEAADKAGQEIPTKQQSYQEKLGDHSKKNRLFRLAEVALTKAPDDANLQKALDKAKTDLEAAEAELVNAKRAISLSIRNRDLAAKLTGDAARKVAEAKARKATNDSAMEILKAQREALQKKIAEELPKQALVGIAFSTDGTQVYTATKTGDVEVYVADSGTHLESLNLGQEIEGIEVGQTNQLISLLKGGKGMAWNIERNWEAHTQIGDGDDPALLIDRVTALSFSPGGDSLITGSGVPSRSGRLKIWDTKTLTAVAENVEAHSDTITEIVLSPDGSQLATGSTDKFVKTFDAETLEHLQSFEAHTGHVLGVDWSPDGRHLASASADQEVKLWSLESGEQTKTLKGWSKEVTSVSFVSGASEQVITTSGDKSIKLDTSAISGSSGFLFTSTVSRDGSLIAAGGQDGVLRLWTAKDRKLVQSFEPPKSSQEVAANQ